MCGVFGFVSRNQGRVDLQVLRRVAQATERRGPHAFGFAWIDRRGRLKCYKQTGRVGDHLGLLGMAADARMLIGHCRFATQGSPADNINNHPHPADGGWLVHNGQVLLARRMGKRRIIAETGAGQHGVATATACALFDLPCIVYMGATDIERQKPNVFRMKLLGAEVVPVHSGTATLGESAAAASIGLINSVGNLGGFVGPFALGYLATRTGSFVAGLTWLVASLFLGGILVLCVHGVGRPRAAHLDLPPSDT